MTKVKKIKELSEKSGCGYQACAHALDVTSCPEAAYEYLCLKGIAVRRMKRNPNPKGGNFVPWEEDDYIYTAERWAKLGR